MSAQLQKYLACGGVLAVASLFSETTTMPVHGLALSKKAGKD